MQVMRRSEQQRPRLRRLGDQLGAFYTPLAVAIAVAAWVASGEPIRFLAVLVVATPCPLLIAIPVAIIGSISLAARRGIIIKDPAVLEQIDTCRTVIFDKTGTLTYGEPHLVEQDMSARRLQPGRKCWPTVASLERYSKHPAVAGDRRGGASARALELREVDRDPRAARRGAARQRSPGTTCGSPAASNCSPRSRRPPTDLPPVAGGLECCIAIDGHYAGALSRFATSRAPTACRSSAT